MLTLQLLRVDLLVVTGDTDTDTDTNIDTEVSIIPILRSNLKVSILRYCRCLKRYDATVHVKCQLCLAQHAAER